MARADGSSGWRLVIPSEQGPETCISAFLAPNTMPGTAQVLNTYTLVMNGWMDRWMDGQADNGCLDRRKDRPQIGWMNEEKKGRE